MVTDQADGAGAVLVIVVGMVVTGFVESHGVEAAAGEGENMVHFLNKLRMRERSVTEFDENSGQGTCGFAGGLGRGDDLVSLDVAVRMTTAWVLSYAFRGGGEGISSMIWECSVPGSMAVALPMGDTKSCFTCVVRRMGANFAVGRDSGMGASSFCFSCSAATARQRSQGWAPERMSATASVRPSLGARSWIMVTQAIPCPR